MGVNMLRSYDIRLISPFRLLLAGPSGCGKTTWMYTFLKEHENIMETPPAKIIIYYEIWQPIYDSIREKKLADFQKGAPTSEEIKNLDIYAPVGGTLVIIDDQVLSVNKEIAQIFSVTARHSYVSLIFMTQNLFSKDKFFRDISLQSTYMVLFKNPRDMSTIRHIAQQIMPLNVPFIVSSFNHAISKPFSYFFIDLHQKTEDHIRFRTNIFYKERPVVVYIPPSIQDKV